jgi:hypothetical protein
MSSDLAARIVIAYRHVASGRSVLARQRSVITKKNKLSIDVSGSEELLVVFEKSQAIFEDDLERLLREQDRK